MKTKRRLHGNRFWLGIYLMSTMVLSFQNCGPSFSSNSSSVALDSIQSANIITADDANNYSPGQNLSFSFDKSLVGNGPLVWSNLLNSTTTCTEVSSDNADPYIVNCTGKGILAITLVVNSGTGGVIGPLTANYVVNDGLPRSSTLVPFVITATSGDLNHPGVSQGTYVPSFLTGGNNFIIKEKDLATTAGVFQFSFNPGQMFLNNNNTVANWSLSGSCTGAANGNNFNVTCPTPVLPATSFSTPLTFTVTLNVTGSDPLFGPYSIPSASYNGSYSGAAPDPAGKNSVLGGGPVLPPAAIAAGTPDPLSPNYIGPQELLTTNVVFVGQTLRIYNKASATKQFGLSFNGTPCASTGPIPYSEAKDYSKFVDCKITAEFGDPAVGSPIANTYDPSQRFFLIAIDGTKLYNNNCIFCHGTLAAARSGNIGNETLVRLKSAIQGGVQAMNQVDNTYSSHLSNLTDAQKLAIIYALRL